MTNLQKLQQALREREIAAVLLSNIANVQWVSGFSGSSAWVLATPADAVFLTDSRYTVQAKTEVKDMPSDSYASPVLSAQFLARHIEGRGIRQLGFESDSVTVSTLKEWEAAFQGVQLTPVAELVGPLRMVKSAEEIEGIRKACALADQCFDNVRRILRPGVSELEVAIEIEFFFRKRGATAAFPVIAASGENSAKPHGTATEKVIEEGDFLTLDFGACLNGFNSDITRTVVIGEPSTRQREVYGQVLQAQLASLEAMKPGIPAKEVDAVARRVLAEADLAGYFGHGLGHGLGMLVHDFGRLAPTSEHVLAPGQVWTVEPGVYIEGFGGVRIEDDVVVTESGIETLTHSPKDLLTFPEGR